MVASVYWAASIRSTETRSKERVPFQTTSATERSRLYFAIVPVRLFQSGRARYLAVAMYTRTPLSFSFISIIGVRSKIGWAEYWIEIRSGVFLMGRRRSLDGPP